MKYRGKELKELSLSELQDALHELAHMDHHRVTKLADNPDKAAKINVQENPVFTQLINKINEQLKVKQDA